MYEMHDICDSVPIQLKVLFAKDLDDYFLHNDVKKL